MTGSATTRPLGRRSKLPDGLGQLWLPRRRPASVDKVICASGLSLGHSRQRLFLPEALVWPRLVVEAGVLRDEAQKMALAKHEDMVEQFAPESADKALGEGVHVRGPDTAVRTTLVPTASRRLANRAPRLASRSTTS